MLAVIKRWRCLTYLFVGVYTCRVLRRKPQVKMPDFKTTFYAPVTFIALFTHKGRPQFPESDGKHGDAPEGGFVRGPHFLGEFQNWGRIQALILAPTYHP